MSKRSPLLLLIALLAGTLTLPALARDCEKGATSMAAVRSCVAEDHDHQLDAAYAKTLAFVRAKDAKTADLLAAAQKSWKQFAEDSCAYTTAARQTEQMANDARLSCWASFVDARVRVLNAYRRQFGKADMP